MHSLIVVEPVSSGVEYRRSWQPRKVPQMLICRGTGEDNFQKLELQKDMINIR
jgi:hypothetical protein